MVTVELEFDQEALLKQMAADLELTPSQAASLLLSSRLAILGGPDER